MNIINDWRIIFLMFLSIIFQHNAFAFQDLASSKQNVSLGFRLMSYRTQMYLNDLGDEIYKDDKLDVIGKIDSPQDEGKTVSIYAVMVHNNDFYMKNQQGEWVSWDQRVETLQSTGNVKLNRNQRINIITKLENFPGNFLIFFGYLADENIIYNTAPIQFNIKDTNRSSYNFLSPLLLSQYVPPKIKTAPVLEATVSELYHYQIEVQTYNSPNVEFSLENAPVGATINSDTGEVNWTPTLDQEGIQAFTISVIDGNGLKSSQSFEVIVYSGIPKITSAAVSEATVDHLYQYQVIGEDRDPLQYSLNQAPPGAVIDAESGLIQWTPTPEQEGPHPFIIQVIDTDGLTAIQAFQVIAGANLTAEIIANPTSGASPLSVRFSSDIFNNNIVVNSYQWDFNNDGTIDNSDTFGAPKTYTYTGNPGDTFTAKLTVNLAQGEQLFATKIITIENTPPVAQVNSNVTNGHAPLNVVFTVTAEDPHGIETIAIDYDGDGVFDDTQNGNGLIADSWTFQTNYSQEGNFIATIKITDQFGGETLISNNAITVDVNNPQDPIIALTATPMNGQAPLTVALSADATIFDGSAINQWKWDLDGDGSFETTGGVALTDNQNFVYAAVGHFYPTVQLTTDSGRMAQASLLIETEPTGIPSLNIPNSDDTINTDAMEIADFTVTLPNETDLAVWIEDAIGANIKTIQSKQNTAAGNHIFSWDGKNEQDEVVAEGDYYVVVGYTEYGIDKEVDLRTTTGGQLSYYRRSTANPRRFNRLEQPLVINFEVDNPAEITFFWQISFSTRLMTLMEHEPMGRGQYSLYWNADFPSGEKVPDSLTTLMPGIVRYDLPYNVIYVKSMPRIEDFVLKSTIMADPRREAIAFDITLSKAGIVELVVADMEKGLDVATRVFQDLGGGQHTLEWDGKNNNDQYLFPGDYRIGVRSVDEKGNRSLYWYRTQRIHY